jgi:glycosyltransferase involved in cell wall biosynthesis
LGVLRQEKGQDAAIEAARRLPNLRLFLIGRDGPGAEHWIEAQKKSAPPGVIFYGETKSVAETIDAEDIALNLVPSRWEEPFGLVALEGMACSCLTIVRAVAGLKDIADVTGALTFQNDSELPALIGRILETDSKDLAALARAQYEATMSVYTAEGFRARALSLLQSLTHPVNPAQYRQPGLTVGKPPKE